MKSVLVEMFAAVMIMADLPMSASAAEGDLHLERLPKNLEVVSLTKTSIAVEGEPCDGVGWRMGNYGSNCTGGGHQVYDSVDLHDEDGGYPDYYEYEFAGRKPGTLYTIEVVTYVGWLGTSESPAANVCIKTLGTASQNLLAEICQTGIPFIYMAKHGKLCTVELIGAVRPHAPGRR